MICKNDTLALLLRAGQTALSFAALGGWSDYAILKGEHVAETHRKKFLQFEDMKTLTGVASALLTSLGALITSSANNRLGVVVEQIASRPSSRPRPSSPRLTAQRLNFERAARRPDHADVIPPHPDCRARAGARRPQLPVNEHEAVRVQRALDRGRPADEVEREPRRLFVTRREKDVGDEREGRGEEDSEEEEEGDHRLSFEALVSSSETRP